MGTPDILAYSIILICIIGAAIFCPYYPKKSKP